MNIPAALWKIKGKFLERKAVDVPRDLPVGNGNVLINYDDTYNVRDVYFPYVGQENQASNHLSHFGVWSAEGFFWIDSPEASREMKYLPDSLITNVACRHSRLGLNIVIRDGVDVLENVFLRKIRIENAWDTPRQIKLYFHLDLELYGNGIGDTIYLDPELNSLIFYKAHRYLSLTGYVPELKEIKPSSFAIGQKGIHGLEGTWRDAEDGELGRNPIAQGSVDGTLELELQIGAKETKEAWFWICFAQDKGELERLEQQVRELMPQTLLQRTYDHWVKWVNRDVHDMQLLEPELNDFYKRSLLTIRTNIDNRGAVIAANDSDILKFARDTYSYMWPRDGALVAHALDRAGYYDLTRNFFEFCKLALTPEGYLMHKYNPDGSTGSSWHPWINEQGMKQLAIQEDETALTVYALWHHHMLADTLEESMDDYEAFVVPAANFMVQYRDASGLPLPSYDLWEERYGVMSFTVASVYAGLMAAAGFAQFHKDAVRAEYYRDTADKMKKAAEAQLYSEAEQRFLRALYWNYNESKYEQDTTLDMSMYALFDFEMFAADDPRIIATMKALRERLWVQTNIGGIARYENDYYHQVSQDIGKVPGNPWFICTLWYAEWSIAVARSIEELEEAKQLLYWAVHHSLPSGIMAEQLDPFSGRPVSVSPLTWSHASFVKVIQEYMSRLKALTKEGSRKTEDISEAEVLQTIHS